ncbi:MAG: CCA tRNA nucleotidyltransferase [Bacteroidaceae bacterium]|nr:CCA tRNA nucleotidyltransferase [Bacteroidaceae bacterium]
MKILTADELRKSVNTPIFRLIGEVADEEGLECYVIGGFVRDLFLGRPSNDVDCVVIGSGVRMAKAVAARLKAQTGRKPHLAVYANFGTAQIALKGLELEFVGARKESYSHDSRKPVVEDGTLEDDQNRRDFTINAMAICLNKERFGKLLDPFDGIGDLGRGIIRTPLDPDITFSDDPLRMLRCVRFASQLKFEILEETREALRRNASRLKIISGERIQEEFNKILLTEQPSRGIYELYDTGLLQQFLPELCALDVVETRNGRAHKNNFYHTLEVVDQVAATARDESFLWLRWAALLHDIGKPKSKRWDNVLGWTFHNHNYIGAKMVPQIFRRMGLPLDARMKYVQKLVDLHMRPIAIADEEVTDSAVRRLLSDAGDDIDDLMTLCEADITSKNEVRKKTFRENFRMVREKLTDLQERDYKRLFQPCIDGNEIMEMFGLQPSREVGLLKQRLKDAILDGEIENEREPALTLLKDEASKIGLKICADNK